MSVRVMERVTTIIENTPEGSKIAKGLEEKLCLQGALIGRSVDSNNIIIEAEYYAIVSGEEEE